MTDTEDGRNRVLLFVGDDWAEDHHDVELMDPAGSRLAKARLPEGMAGIARLHAMIGAQLGVPGSARLTATFTGMPPTLIQVGSHEALLVDAELMAEASLPLAPNVSCKSGTDNARVSISRRPVIRSKASNYRNRTVRTGCGAGPIGLRSLEVFLPTHATSSGSWMSSLSEGEDPVRGSMRVGRNAWYANR
nr:hypothetical protein [Rhodococcus sp. WAY2]